MEFDNGNNESGKYEFEAIHNSMVYIKESKGQLPGLYYLILWKGYLEEKNTWEPTSAIQYLRRLVTTFHKNYLDKPTATSPLIDIAPPMTKSTIRPKAFMIKQKLGWSAKTVRANKYDKKS